MNEEFPKKIEKHKSPEGGGIEREARRVVKRYIQNFYRVADGLRQEFETIISGNLENTTNTQRILEMQKWFRNQDKKISYKLKFITSFGDDSPRDSRIELLSIQNAIRRYSFFHLPGIDENTMDEMKELFSLLKDKMEDPST